MDDLHYRSVFLVDIFKKYVKKSYSILEIGSGDGRNVKWLSNCGYKNVEGIDKENGISIEEMEPKKYDVIFTMSTLFLIKDETIFEKIAKMTKKLLITIEGETTKGNGVIGRDYNKIFSRLGFLQIDHKDHVFNQYGVLRVFKKI